VLQLHSQELLEQVVQLRPEEQLQQAEPQQQGEEQQQHSQEALEQTCT
jgi:hypothetical protein